MGLVGWSLFGIKERAVGEHGAAYAERDNGEVRQDDCENARTPEKRAEGGRPVVVDGKRLSRRVQCARNPP